MFHEKSRRLALPISMLVLLSCSDGGGATDLGGDGGDRGDDKPQVPVGPPIGVAVSPLGFPIEYSQLDEFYNEVADWPRGAGSTMWNGPWHDDFAAGTDAGSTPPAAVINMNAADVQGTLPVLVFGWRNGNLLGLTVPGNPTNNWTNMEARRLFRDMLVRFADDFEPPYLFIGNENDFYFEQDSTDYERWVEFYEEAYDSIKAVSPQTRIGVVFNYENLSGRGALVNFGGPSWHALEAHDLSKIDVLGLTLYPFFSAGTVQAVSDGHMSPLRDRIGNKPILITETGWPADAYGLPWAGGENEQVAYLFKLRSILEGFNVDRIQWLFLHPMRDPGGSPFEWRAFSSISLRREDGTERPVHDSFLLFDFDG